ncbi:hypothetical protein GCM10009746_30790 [Microbacterium paludicola]
MCDPRPGPRCSAHTAQQLSRAQKRCARARDTAERSPDDRRARQRLARAEEYLQRKQEAYDSSPRGQRELVAQISSAPEPTASEIDSLRTRLSVGRATRIQQQRSLARVNGLSAQLEAEEIARALRRVRHPAGYGRHPLVLPSDVVGFLVQGDLERADDVRYLTLWRDGATGEIEVFATEVVTSAARARRLASEPGRRGFWDAQTATAIGAEVSLLYIAPGDALGAIAAERARQKASTE